MKGIYKQILRDSGKPEINEFPASCFRENHMANDLYPITFGPLCRYRDWGSERLNSYFNMPADERGLPPAEVFLLVDGELGSSEVVNGSLAGKTLNELAQLGSEYVGRRKIDGAFPVCIKYLATSHPLALQVHPSDMAARQDKSLNVNHKAWYSIEAQDGAKVHAELRSEYTQQQLLSRIDTEELYELVHSFELTPGDSCYLPSGRVHGVDAGYVILSIEQNNPNTFVLGGHGNSEHLSAPLITVDQAKDYINFKDRRLPRNVADKTQAESRNRKISLINTCPAFSLEEIRLVSKMPHRAGGDSFHIIIPIDGDMEVTTSKHTTRVNRGCACFIPAKLGFYNTVPDGPMRFLRVAT